METLKSGCIGVAAVAAGYSDIGDFKRQLNQGYWSEAKAKEAMKKMKIEGARDVYGQKPCATIVAMQFSPIHWTAPVPANANAKGWWVQREQKDFGAEPVDLNKGESWDAVRHGIDMVPVPGGFKPHENRGAFDVECYSPRIGRWLGANNGVSDATPDMRVFSLSDAELATHIAKGDQKGYTMHLWFVVPEKAYNEK